MEPLTLRYNNPGAVEYQPWMDKYGASRGENGRYAQFASPDQGYQVMGKVLDTYQNKHGLNTVSGIVNRWAPSNVDNNSTGSYVNSVASKLGIGPNDPLTAAHRQPLMQAMAAYEAGRGVAGPSPMNIPVGAAAGSFRAAQETGISPELSPPLMLGGLTQKSAPQSGAPMPKEPQRLPGLLGAIEQGMMSPLFQMGLGTYNAGAEGKNWAGGMLAGAQGQRRSRAEELTNSQHQLALDQANAGRDYLNNLDPNDPQFKGLPPALVSISKGMQDPTILSRAYSLKMDLDRQEQVARMQGNVQLQMHIAQKKADLEADLVQRKQLIEMYQGIKNGGKPSAVRRYNPSTGELE